MSKEQEGRGIPLTAIHLNLKERSLSIEAENETVAKFTLNPEGVIFFHAGHDFGEVGTSLRVAESGAEAPPVETSAADSPFEKEKRLVLTGKLKARPKAGKPDRSGKPTAYARLAAHDEDQSKAHDYIATFHRHTTRIALGLAKDAQITVDGYPHPSGSDQRLDTFSVINILNYPGKPARK